MMKKIQLFSTKTFTFFAAMLLSFVAFAQDKQVDVNLNVDKGGDWYAKPWVWVVGGLIFILLLAAILRGNKKA